MTKCSPFRYFKTSPEIIRLAVMIPNDPHFRGGSGKMRHESKFSTWIRSGGPSEFFVPLSKLALLKQSSQSCPTDFLTASPTTHLKRQRARLVEDLNYAPERLRAIYAYFRDNPDQSELYGRTVDHPADPVSIANLAYADRNGNGDAESGDGWTYRARAPDQLTGRANYREFSTWHEATFAEGIDFEADPDRAAEPVCAVRSAIFFWLDRGLPNCPMRG